MMKLYIYEHCPFCTRARMIVGLKSLPVMLQVIMESDAETPLRLIGKKAVPILQKEDGSHIGESLDIVRYLDGIGPTVLVAPQDPTLDAWVKEAWPTALKLFIPRFVQADFAEINTPMAREAYRLREEQAFGDLEALRGATSKLVAELQPLINDLVPLVKDRTTIGINDVTLWPVLRSLSIVRTVEFPDQVRDYMHRLSEACGVPLLFNQAA
ncbi:MULTISPECIES: glutaredoxin 2 [unclassified Pseudomonas]|jgi:Glutaredoxin, GrxB family|uniref:glutaredoxin 2 n=1 Tax=unclassified Pseudomonas TaxID=196821 RepID=UPI000A0D3FC0|nr:MULTISPECIES: glutaredoxin 2 [unclassified Pseudomonas]SMF18437.1 glutaredoxin 2 [Pseudomonas sp. LAIL14HWK12:I11]SMR77355.1 glutaredoxin 2 [Pseudomonas sp. LAIL14HWK12:I10]SOD02869.1 glutaredoxin 2 [Pseudomonas sp. LAIL14HWK12:I8]